MLLRALNWLCSQVYLCRHQTLVALSIRTTKRCFKSRSCGYDGEGIEDLNFSKIRWETAKVDRRRYWFEGPLYWSYLPWWKWFPRNNMVISPKLTSVAWIHLGQTKKLYYLVISPKNRYFMVFLHLTLWRTILFGSCWPGFADNKTGHLYTQGWSRTRKGLGNSTKVLNACLQGPHTHSRCLFAATKFLLLLRWRDKILLSFSPLGRVGHSTVGIHAEERCLSGQAYEYHAEIGVYHALGQGVVFHTPHGSNALPTAVRYHSATKKAEYTDF